MAAGRAADDRASAMQDRKSYAKRISDNIAYALIIYTMMLIFFVAGAIKTSSMSIFPYLLLLVFVAFVIPSARKLEKKWEMLDNSELSDSNLNKRFNIDRTKLWFGTFLLPILLMFVCKAAASLF